ncbi:MAG: SusC/RagA family TonB-linked outer membrane protein [Candidatus Saccharibacteria bacterium]
MIKNLFTDANWKKAALLVPVLLLSFFSSQAQSSMAKDSILVKGVVVSGTNTPMSNITISIEGSRQMPAVTNEAGEFTIKSSTGNNWLIISPVSDYKTKRVFLNNRSKLKIYLSANDLSAGDDPVTLLSQKTIKKDIVSSYADMKPKDVYKTGANSIDEFMQGRVAGMNVVRRDGTPGSGAIVSLRGANSIMTNTQPLYIIDGLPMENPGLIGSNLEGYSFDPLLAVNPLDISKVSVVKDPTVTSAYGTKASNGVVFIETLDPSATNTSIDVDLRTGYSLSPSNLLPQMNAGQHKTLANEVLFSSGMFEEAIKEKYPNLFLNKTDDRFIDYQHNTNWQDKIFNNATFTNVNLKVKGGDAIARYGLSFGYTTSEGVVKNTSYDSYNLRFVSRLNIFTWLRMNAGVSLNYSYANLKESAKDKQTNPILSALAKSPMLNPYKYDIDGNMLTILSEVDELGVSNPVAIIDKFEGRNTNYHFISSMGFEGTINKNLMLNSNFGLTYHGIKEQVFMPNHGMDHYYNDEAWNVSKASINYLLSFYNNTYFAYKKTINKIHNFTSNTGMNLQTNSYQFDWAMGMNAHQNDEYKALQDGLNNLRRLGGQNRNWNWLSFYEKFNYAFKDKYLLTAGVSLDGSSRVGDEAINTYNVAGNPFGLFYSGGVGWRLSSEPLFKQLSWLDELKVRASYGTSGNDDIGESNATDYYSAIKFRETVGLYPGVLSNKKLSFETITQKNAGVDISLWGSRVRATADLFQTTTDDMLILAPMDSYLGYSVRPENSGQLENKGFEGNVFLRIIDGKSFKWDVQANIAKVQNQIKELKGNIIISDVQGGQIVNEVGAPVNSFYGYIYEGVYASKADADAANLMNGKFVKYQAGDARFADLSGPAGTPDGIINEYDKTNIGSSMPELFGGFQNTFTYKNWTLNALVNFVTGNEVFNYVRYENEKMSGLENQSTTVLSRWQFDGQQTNVPRALWHDPVGNSAFSTRWIEDGSYVRLQNVSLGYSIPNKFLSFRNAEFYISANNVYTLTKYLGYDPEFANSYLQAEQGIDYGQTPQPRQFIIGIKLGL